MSHELFFDPEMPSALAALADERTLRTEAFDAYVTEIGLYFEQTTLDQVDREWLTVDYARVSFTRMAYELQYVLRLHELTQDDADQQDFERLDQRLGEAVNDVLEARVDARQAGVDVNEILTQYNLVQYRLTE